jgi:hypothetical protein
MQPMRPMRPMQPMTSQRVLLVVRAAAEAFGLAAAFFVVEASAY